MTHDFSVYKKRRKELIDLVKQQFPERKGKIVLFASFENERAVFRQDSSMYYFTGLQEPGIVMVLDLHNGSDLYIPNCDKERAKWMVSEIPLTQANAAKLGFSKVHYLGSQCPGYQFHPFFPQQEYQALITEIENIVLDGGALFTLMPSTPHSYIDQRLIVERLKGFIPRLSEHLVDISSCVAQLRRKKDMTEMEALYKAVEITVLAQEAAANSIADGMQECEVQASVEYMMTGSQARIAFPSIVASGKNATILHYHANNAVMRKGDLVIVDVGAEFDYYCGDLTRTYPVSGTFTSRQRELYKLVLETQEYIADLAKPGMWLSNKEYPDKSLNHLAKKYLQDRGYGEYFIHGIGHFLGLDVHDVGDSSKPLQEGDVITIEPGIYIPQERIGIRIEDNYWIVKDGVICLSEHLPKEPEDIEAMIQQTYEKPDSDDEESDEYDDDMETND